MERPRAKAKNGSSVQSSTTVPKHTKNATRHVASLVSPQKPTTSPIKSVKSPHFRLHLYPQYTTHLQRTHGSSLFTHFRDTLGARGAEIQVCPLSWAPTAPATSRLNPRWIAAVGSLLYPGDTHLTLQVGENRAVRVVFPRVGVQRTILVWSPLGRHGHRVHFGTFRYIRNERCWHHLHELRLWPQHHPSRCKPRWLLSSVPRTNIRGLCRELNPNSRVQMFRKQPMFLTAEFSSYQSPICQTLRGAKMAWSFVHETRRTEKRPRLVVEIPDDPKRAAQRQKKFSVTLRLCLRQQRNCQQDGRKDALP